MRVRRPRSTAPRAQLAGARMTAAELDALATQAAYVGSGDHKDCPNFTGAFHPRRGAIGVQQADDEGVEDPDCMICPRKWAARQDAATALLRQAIRDGLFVTDATDLDRLPNRVWARDPESAFLIYEARKLSAPATGYKAYPLTRSQAQRSPFRFS